MPSGRRFLQFHALVRPNLALSTCCKPALTHHLLYATVTTSLFTLMYVRHHRLEHTDSRALSFPSSSYLLHTQSRSYKIHSRLVSVLVLLSVFPVQDVTGLRFATERRILNSLDSGRNFFPHWLICHRAKETWTTMQRITDALRSRAVQIERTYYLITSSSTGIQPLSVTPMTHCTCVGSASASSTKPQRYHSSALF